MSTTTTIDKLKSLKLAGMAQAFEDQIASTTFNELSFEERIAIMIDREATHRSNRNYQTRLRLARLKEPQARLEDIDFKASRGLDKSLILSLSNGDWIRSHQNIFAIGPSGVRKTFIICPLAHRACLDGFLVRYYRLPRLLEELNIARAAGRYPQLLSYLAKVHVLILDDWGLSPLFVDERRDFLEVIEDRYSLQSTVIASQMPVDKWYGLIGDPTIADAILDRLIHSAHRLTLRGQSQRKARSTLTVD